MADNNTLPDLTDKIALPSAAETQAQFNQAFATPVPGSEQQAPISQPQGPQPASIDSTEPDATPTEINVTTPEGDLVSISTGQLQEAISHGYKPATEEEVHKYFNEQKYGTGKEMLKTAAEGIAKGLVGPLAPLAEKALGVKEEDIRGRAEANPGIHTASEVGGFIAPAFASLGGAGLAKLGLEGAGAALEGASKFTQLGALEKLGKFAPVANTLAGKIGVGAARGAVDNMLLQGSDEVSKMILNDPNASADHALSNMGMAAGIGAVLGGGAPAISALWKATVGDKASKLINDFKGRIQEHVTNPEPVKAVGDELNNYYTTIRNSADEVYGPQGLKTQDIAKSMPEMSPKITQQAQDIYNTMSKKLEDMAAKPNRYPERLTSRLQGDLEEFTSAISKDNLSSADVFNAAQDLKSKFQSYSKFDKFVKPVDEAYDFVNSAKELSADLREKLEDHSVWGKAAKRQQAINSAFKEYLPALKDFEKKFTSEVGGERVIDPAKVNTYVSQLGKSSSEIKQTMLKNFLDASERYKKVINESTQNIGLEPVLHDTPLTATMSTLGKKTIGAKMADAFIEKGLTQGGGQALGATAGAVLGKQVGGHYGVELGAIIGQHALGPFFSSILPGIAKTILERPTASADGFKAAIDYTYAIKKGVNELNLGVKRVFDKDSQQSPNTRMPTEADRAKLTKQLKNLQLNPDAMLKAGDQVGSYLPSHTGAIGQTMMTSVNYLNSLRPSEARAMPLDTKPTPDKTQTASYNRALDIAENPLIVLNKIKDGTITPSEILSLKTMYPALHSQIAQKLQDHIIENAHKGDLIPYKTRVGVSMFTGQPLDSTMMPASIISAQEANMGSQQKQDAAQQQQSAPASKTNKLSKLPSQYQTASQARESERTKP